MQHTLEKDMQTKGIGLHSGKNITLTLCPAAVDSGIVFLRTDIENQDNLVPALWNCVVDTRLCTVIGNTDGVTIGTIEHLMAALRGCGVDNAEIRLDGPEVPIMDGSAQPFIDMIEEAGLAPQAAPRRAIRVLKEVRVEKDGKCVSLKPASESIFGGEIEFKHPEIGHQSFKTTLLNGNFKHDVAEARTFGFLNEVKQLRESGLALGGSLENAIVLDDEHVLNSGGLRFEDEFIRHKILDAIGDLYLAGGPILGAYEGAKAGHAMNNAILHALFADETAWEIVDLYGDSAGPAAQAELRMVASA